MGSTEIVGGKIESVYVGSTSVPNPILILEYNGVIVPGSYVVQEIGSSVRYIFPRVSGSNIYLTSMAQVYGSDLPAITANIKVYISS